MSRSSNNILSDWIRLINPVIITPIVPWFEAPNLASYLATQNRHCSVTILLAIMARYHRIWHLWRIMEKKRRSDYSTIMTRSRFKYHGTTRCQGLTVQSLFKFGIRAIQTKFVPVPRKMNFIPQPGSSIWSLDTLALNGLLLHLPKFTNTQADLELESHCQLF